MFKLDNDEQILIKSENTLFYFYISIVSVAFFSLIFILNFDIISLYDFLLVYVIAPVFFLIILFGFFFSYDYSFNSSVYLTNKRFVFCKKNKFSNVKFSDVSWVSCQNNWFIIKDCFGNKHRAIAKNAPLILKEFLTIYPQYNQKEKEQNPIIWIFIIFLIFVFNKYGRPYLKNTPSPYIKISTDNYMSNMQNKIKHNWQSNLWVGDEEVVASFSILEDGKISNIKIVESSGSKELDLSAVDALKQSSPFLALPKQLKKKKNSIDVTFTFQCK